MTLETFRARYFNPEKWVTTGLTWAALALLFMTAIEYVSKGSLQEHNWLPRLIIFAVAGLAFGLLFRWTSRREQDNAR